MQTKHIANTFLVLIVILGVFGGVYYFNEDFRILVKNFKDGDVAPTNVTDNLNLDDSADNLEDSFDNKDDENIENDTEVENNFDEINITNGDGDNEINAGGEDLSIDGIEINLGGEDDKNAQDTEANSNLTQTLVLSEEEKSFLDKFNKYSLSLNENMLPLFGILRDYNEKYLSYSDKNSKLDIYFLGKQDYNKIKLYFEGKLQDINMEINEINNFGEFSFYLNSPDNNTGRTRIVLSQGGYVYAIGMDKNEYNNIKQILLNL